VDFGFSLTKLTYLLYTESLIALSSFKKTEFFSVVLVWVKIKFSSVFNLKLEDFIKTLIASLTTQEDENVTSNDIDVKNVEKEMKWKIWLRHWRVDVMRRFFLTFLYSYFFFIFASISSLMSFLRVNWAWKEVRLKRTTWNLLIEWFFRHRKIISSNRLEQS
jgi:hypothetical protein